MPTQQISGIFRGPQGHGTPYPYKLPIPLPEEFLKIWEWYGSRLPEGGPVIESSLEQKLV